MKTRLTSGPFLILTLALSARLFFLAVLAQSPAPDEFNPGTADGIYDYVTTLAVQPDGKILVGGRFASLDGQNRANIGRLDGNGTLDTRFDPEAGGGLVEVTSFAVQSDGKIVVGGVFENLSGQSRIHIGRLNSDGTLDTTFNPGADGGYSPRINALAVQADGKILLGGEFRILGGQSRNDIGRLNADGTLDTSFNAGAGPTFDSFDSFRFVSAIAVQPDGKILVGGSFPNLGGKGRASIGRLNADGTIDTSFNPGADLLVLALAVQADGRILVGGTFSRLAGQSRANLGRLNPNGTLDTSFNPGANSSVVSLVLQTDGKILVGGYFTTLGGQNRSNIARLNSDGSLDISFDPGTDRQVHSLALQSDGKVLVGGYFTTVGGQNRSRIGRLNSTEPATQSLTFDGSTLTWMRGGTSPEVWRMDFGYSSDGISWRDLGAGGRITGGWQLAGLELPANRTVRARGYLTGGNHSSWFVETVVGPPVINYQPASVTNNATTTAVFNVESVGSQPLSYRWRKDGQDLVEGGSLSGTAAPTLTLSNILRGDGAHYSVVISNSFGNVTSEVVTLGVIDPAITAQPVSLTNNATTTASFHVDARGDASLNYRWRKDGKELIDGENVSGATTAQLTLGNVLHRDAGGYSVVVTDAAGSVTSEVATMTVIDPAINAQPFDHIKNVGESLTLKVEAVGTPPLSYQWWKDGAPLSGETQSSLTFASLHGSDAGSYEVVVSNAWGSMTTTSARLTVYLHTPHYVDLNSTSPVPPYTTWATAASNIQDAIDAAEAGDDIVVTNGVYATGTRVVDGTTMNRVAVTKPMTLRSVNGPDVTVIEGYQVPGTTNGDGAVRCVYLGEGAALLGFTLTHGATRGVFVPSESERSGGGVWCTTSSAVVSNCVFVANSAAYLGGGAYQGTLNNCTLMGNSAVGGGGAQESTLNSCTLVGNSAYEGGGAVGSTLNNCTLSGNSATTDGGGAVGGTLNNCALNGNSAQTGGGASRSTLQNCTLAGNSAGISGGGAFGGTLNNCTLVGNSANQSGGGVGGSRNPFSSVIPILNNCIIYYNVAGEEGDNFYSYSELNGSCTTPLPLSGLGNFENRPRLVDFAGGDFRLQPDSPCINAGLNAYATDGTELDGNPRISGGTIDVGAYEFQSPQSMLSYAWLLQFGLPTDGTADNLDLDGDQSTNFQEWLAGTDPGNANSLLHFLMPEPLGSDIVLRWFSVPGREYYLERSTNISSFGSFVPIARNIPGQADFTTFIDQNVTTNSERYFYRVAVE